MENLINSQINVDDMSVSEKKEYYEELRKNV